jgi:D-3-phosphoglycerate dehydrogenase / 2-oxoglutarate reductase
MHRVIVLDTLAEEGLSLLRQADGIEFDVKTGLKGEALREALRGYDAAICRSGVKLDAASLEGNRRLKVIVRAGVGTDNIDRAAATRLGIIVMNTPAGNTLSTAEHTFALILGLARNIAAADQSLRQGKWNRNEYLGAQLADKTLGIVGLGRIGREVARRAQAFDMRVIGFDPFLAPDRARELNIEPVATVDEMLSRIDFLTVHTPLTPETTALIGAEQIEQMKPSVRLINCARGGIYDEAAVADALQRGRIAGAAFDVYAEEPCTKSPLFESRRTLCTPHLGASTEEAQTQVAVEGVGLILDFLQRGEIRHAVNMTPIDPQTLDALRGFLDVAYRLGIFAAQWQDGSPLQIRLSYRGDQISKNSPLLTSAFCAGFLVNAMDEPVNIVNATVLMQDRGIEYVTESHSEPGVFNASIRATMRSERGELTIAGTLLGSNMPRLIQLNGYRLEAFLDGTLLVFLHRDVPGIIGRVGTIFGDHQVNIAQMTVGRESTEAGGNAIGVLNVDSTPSDAAVQAVVGHPDIHTARVIHLPKAGVLPEWLQG